MSDLNGKEPDLPPHPFGGLKRIERLASMHQHAPKIKWGSDYQSWPIEKRLNHAERLAAAMNHAADVLQSERNELLKLVAHQEAQLKQSAVKYLEQGDLIHRQLQKASDKRHEMSACITQLRTENRALKNRVKELEDGHHD